ncbi:hypothetical protein Tco_0391187 [Tanacetum coccineum]
MFSRGMKVMADDRGKGFDSEYRPRYNEEPMAEVQMTDGECFCLQDNKSLRQPEFSNNEGTVDQNAVQCHEYILYLLN